MFWKVLSAPSVWFPAGLGALALAWAAFSGDPLGSVGLVGAGSLLLGTGAAVGRGVFFREQLARELKAERDPEHQRQLERLQQLGKKLRRDFDQRTDDCLAQLRKLYDRLRAHSLVASLPARLQPEIKEHLRELYDSCLNVLERIHALGEAARQMSTDEARHDVQTAREELFDELRAGVAYLAGTVDRLQAAAVLPHADDEENRELRRAREELDQGLEVARRVEQRMSQIETSVEDRMSRKLDQESP